MVINNEKNIKKEVIMPTKTSLLMLKVIKNLLDMLQEKLSYTKDKPDKNPSLDELTEYNKIVNNICKLLVIRPREATKELNMVYESLAKLRDDTLLQILDSKINSVISKSKPETIINKELSTDLQEIIIIIEMIDDLTSSTKYPIL